MLWSPLLHPPQSLFLALQARLRMSRSPQSHGGVGEEDAAWEWRCPGGHLLTPTTFGKPRLCDSCSSVCLAGVEFLYSSESNWGACEECVGMAMEGPVEERISRSGSGDELQDESVLGSAPTAAVGSRPRSPPAREQRQQRSEEGPFSPRSSAGAAPSSSEPSPERHPGGDLLEAARLRAELDEQKREVEELRGKLQEATAKQEMDLQKREVAELRRQLFEATTRHEIDLQKREVEELRRKLHEATTRQEVGVDTNTAAELPEGCLLPPRTAAVGFRREAATAWPRRRSCVWGPRISAE